MFRFEFIQFIFENVLIVLDNLSYELLIDKKIQNTTSSKARSRLEYG